MRNVVASRNSRRGASMVEFALTILVFLTLVLGAFEVSRAIWTYSTVSYAAKQGVRYAMIHGADNAGVDSNGSSLSQSDVDDQVENVVKASAPGLDTSNLTVTTTWTPNNTPGSTVKVSVTFPFESMFGPIAPTLTGLNMNTEYQMIVTN